MSAINAKSLNTRTASLHSPEVRKAASTFDNLPDSGYIRQSQLIPDVVPFSSATLWRKCKNGTFVSPVRLGARVRLRSISAGARRGSSAGMGAVEETGDLGGWADVFMHKDYVEH